MLWVSNKLTILCLLTGALSEYDICGNICSMDISMEDSLLAVSSSDSIEIYDLWNAINNKSKTLAIMKEYKLKQSVPVKVMFSYRNMLLSVSKIAHSYK